MVLMYSIHQNKWMLLEIYFEIFIGENTIFNDAGSWRR